MRNNALRNDISFKPRYICYATSAVCLDANQNLVSCLDPDCTYGDCGSTAAAQTNGAACLDNNQNPISCSDPECTYGDCTPNPTAAIGLAAHSNENGGTSLTTPSSGGATQAGSTSTLLSSVLNAVATTEKTFTAPPKTTLSLGSSGLSVSSAGSLFSNPLMLVMLAIIAALVFGLWRKRS